MDFGALMSEMGPVLAQILGGGGGTLAPDPHASAAAPSAPASAGMPDVPQRPRSTPLPSAHAAAAAGSETLETTHACSGTSRSFPAGTCIPAVLCVRLTCLSAMAPQMPRPSQRWTPLWSVWSVQSCRLRMPTGGSTRCALTHRSCGSKSPSSGRSAAATRLAACTHPARLIGCSRNVSGFVTFACVKICLQFDAVSAQLGVEHFNVV